MVEKSWQIWHDCDSTPYRPDQGNKSDRFTRSVVSSSCSLIIGLFACVLRFRDWVFLCCQPHAQGHLRTTEKRRDKQTKRMRKRRKTGTGKQTGRETWKQRQTAMEQKHNTNNNQKIQRETLSSLREGGGGGEATNEATIERMHYANLSTVWLERNESSRQNEKNE